MWYICRAYILGFYFKLIAPNFEVDYLPSLYKHSKLGAFYFMAYYPKKNEIRFCQKCGNKFTGHPHTKYCSEKCRLKIIEIEPPSNSPAVLCSGTKGAIGELAVSLDLMNKGYHVYRALSPNAPYDIVAVKDGIAYLYEVRTASSRITLEGIRRLHWPRQNTAGKLVALFVPASKEIIYLKENEL